MTGQRRTPQPAKHASRQPQASSQSGGNDASDMLATIVYPNGYSMEDSNPPADSGEEG